MTAEQLSRIHALLAELQQLSYVGGNINASTIGRLQAEAFSIDIDIRAVLRQIKVPIVKA